MACGYPTLDQFVADMTQIAEEARTNPDLLHEAPQDTPVGRLDEVRAATRRILEACMPGGGYALGSGNSVANYVKLENYLAMLDEGRTVGRYA